MLSHESLEEFKRIWKEETGQDLSDDVAMEQAISLVTMLDATYRPITKNWNDEYENQT